MRIFLVQRAATRVDLGTAECATVVAETATDARVLLGDAGGCARSEWLRADTMVAEIGAATDGAPARVLLMTYATPLN